MFTKFYNTISSKLNVSLILINTFVTGKNKGVCSNISRPSWGPWFAFEAQSFFAESKDVSYSGTQQQGYEYWTAAASE